MASVIAVNPDVETAIAKLAGITDYDPGTFDIELVNTAGPITTLRYTGHVDVDTVALLTIIEQASAEVIATLNAANEQPAQPSA